MKRTLSRAALALAAAAAATVYASDAHAANYYFSGDGSSGGSGTQADPFRTLDPINSLDLDPGDNVYLSGAFNAATGGIQLSAQDSGTATNPVSFIGVGSSRPTINAGDSFGFKAYDAGGIDLRNINFVGNGPASRVTNAADPNFGLFTNTEDGVQFYTNAGEKKSRIYVDNVYVRGFGVNGIKVGADTGQSGFNDVKITNSIVEKNQHAGVNFEGDFDQADRSAHTNVLISHVRAFDTTGRANRPHQGNTGSGIVIGQVNGGVIQYSVAKNNGKQCASDAGGPVGIWAWDSNNVKIQFNEAFNNGTAGHHDGGGFDLDGGVTNSVMQYNYSHENEGAGFLLAQFENAKPFTGNVVRYNISQKDGRKNGYGGIHAFGPIGNTDVYNNTIFMTPAEKGLPNTRPNDAPAAVRFRDGTMKEIDFYNNLFIIKDNDGNPALFNPQMLALSSADEQTFLNNNYWIWDGTAFTNPADPNSMNFNPLLIGMTDEDDDIGGGTFDDIESYRLAELLEYQLDNSSPLIDQGIDLAALFGIDAGPHDFYGSGPHGAGYDIGAHESLVGGLPLESVWDKDDSVSNSSDSASWVGGAVPNAIGAAATFGDKITTARTVNVDGTLTVGRIKFDNANSYTLASAAGGGSIVIDAATDGVVHVVSGSHAITAPLALNKNITFAVAPLDSTLTVSSFNANGMNVTKAGAGKLTVNRVRANELNVTAGTVQMIADQSLAGVSRVTTLNIAPGAKVDLGQNKLITDNVPVGTWDGAKYTGLQGEVGRAYNFGAWDLPGLMTSAADAGPTVGKATIGVATGQQALFLAPDETGLFAGETITGATAIAMYTWAGDVDLNGYVDAVDYGTIDQWIQFPGTTGYTNGDLNYDGVIDAVDYGIIDNGIQLQGDLIPVNGGVAGVIGLSGAVPEPTGSALPLVAAAGLLGRRRARRHLCRSRPARRR